MPYKFDESEMSPCDIICGEGWPIQLMHELVML